MLSINFFYCTMGGVFTKNSYEVDSSVEKTSSPNTNKNNKEFSFPVSNKPAKAGKVVGLKNCYFPVIF